MIDRDRETDVERSTQRERENTVMLNIGCVEGKPNGGEKIGGMHGKVGGGVWKI